jgi:ATP-dependent DNA helicase DinG
LSLKELQSEKILALLKEGGALSRHLSSYEPRQEQIEMVEHLVKAFNEGAVALIEAGTGTGKSIAYLIPSILTALLFGERIVISTHTISLQEQLLNKDIPLLKKVLGVDLKVVLVKGMGNYPCQRKINDLQYESSFLPDAEQRVFEEIEKVSLRGWGSKSDLPFYPPSHLWEMVSAEKESCTGQDCPCFSSCSYINSRKEAQDAHILIVNHHLLFADLSVRAETENYLSSAVLPPYTRLVIDEAHHLEEIATEYFSLRLNRLDLLKTMARISTEKQGALSQGKLAQLKERLVKGPEKSLEPKLASHLTIDLPARRRDLLTELAKLFDLLASMQEAMPESQDEKKLRLLPKHYEERFWKEQVAPLGRLCRGLLKHYAADLDALEGLVKDYGSERLFEMSKSLLLDIKALSKKLMETASTLDHLIENVPKRQEIRWIESKLSKSGLNLTLNQASLDISQLMVQYLFNPLHTVVMVSATLTAKGSFAYLKERMGLNQQEKKPLIEAKFDSPFNFEKQAYFVVPKEIASPTEKAFTQEAVQLIRDALYASRGNAFLLFTSYQMMRQFYHILEADLKKEGFHPVCQGEESSQALLQRFLSKERSVLFGTDSFWEGVDVSGDALRLVVIVKLPFKVPTDPLIEARSEELLQQGKDPFTHLLLPQAAIKFKQGFGRLIRKKSDRGCILCLDQRIIKKNYGKYFLQTLPKCPLVILEKDQIKKEMTEFFKRTYHLTK